MVSGLSFIYVNPNSVITHSRLSSFHSSFPIEHLIRNEMSSRNHVNVNCAQNQDCWQNGELHSPT